LKRAVLIATALTACNPGAHLEGLAAAVDRGGPHVVFDLGATPLPQIPFPNDIATTVDPASPTSLRLNSSLLAPSQFQELQQGLLDTLDGFGTFAPITVEFDRDIDFADLAARQNDADPTNDGVYLVDLADGSLAPVDIGGGRFPYTIDDPGRYFVADPSTAAFNLLFPVSGPFANFLNPALPHSTLRQQADDLATFYELSTHTLIIRPVLPLKEDTRYAVVLTDRVRDAGGRPISSPHAGINHSSQTNALAPLLSHLPPGTPLSSITYAWAFTTQSVTRTMRLLRQGLIEGNGPFRSLGLEFTLQSGTAGVAAAAVMNVVQERGILGTTPSAVDSDYILPVNDCAAPPAPPACFKALLDDPDVSALFSGTDAASIPALEASLQYVNYLVTADFVSPELLVSPSTVPGTERFQIDEQSQTVRVQQHVGLRSMFAIPKEVPAAGHLQPFPTVIAGHRFGGSRSEEVVGFGGTFAKFGLATVAIDAFGHGVAVDPALQALAQARADSAGVGPFATAFFVGRARDLDFDGTPDPGADFWTGDAFHTRDTIRQTVVDWMQLIQLLRLFDGNTRMPLAGTNILAGDFNHDGLPDLAGTRTFGNVVFAPDGTTHLFEKGAVNPGADLFTFGVSLGGILSAIAPAIEPEIRATAPVGAGGGLTDVALRTSLQPIVNSIFLQLLGPFFATCSFSPSAGPVDPKTLLHLGACSAGAADAVPTLVMVAPDAGRERDLPIQPLSLSPGDRLMVTDLTQGGTSCASAPAAGCSIAAADATGAARVAFPADGLQLSTNGTTVAAAAPGDSLTVSVLPAAGGAPVSITAFGAPFVFFGVAHTAGEPLTALTSGFGLSRNTPAFRRAMELMQIILEPADPINYAPHYAASLLPPRFSTTAAKGFIAGNVDALVVAVPGDTALPVSAGIALARAVGVVELSQPDPAYGLTDDQVLVRGGVVEGIAATDRFDDPAGGVFAQLPGHVQCSSGTGSCSGAVLLDPSGYACTGATCTDGVSAPRLVPPLREQLFRPTRAPAACPVSTRAGATGCWSIGASSCTPGAPGLSGLLLPYFGPAGQSGIVGPQANAAFDMDQFTANAVGRYFECREGEIRFDACQKDLASCPWIPPPPP
jgi:hypothetical protein